MYQVNALLKRFQINCKTIGFHSQLEKPPYKVDGISVCFPLCFYWNTYHSKLRRYIVCSDSFFQQCNHLRGLVIIERKSKQVTSPHRENVCFWNDHRCSVTHRWTQTDWQRIRLYLRLIQIYAVCCIVLAMISTTEFWFSIQIFTLRLWLKAQILAKMPYVLGDRSLQSTDPQNFWTVAEKDLLWCSPDTCKSPWSPGAQVQTGSGRTRTTWRLH